MLSKLPQKLQDEVKKAKTIDELRSLQSPFVHAGQMTDLIKRAARVFKEAPEGFWQKAAPRIVEGTVGASIGLATHNPVAVLLPLLYESPMIKEVIGLS